MFAIAPEPREKMLEIARAFQQQDVSYTFSKDEEKALRPFFTNLNKPTFFVFSLPSTVGTALLAMFSRMKDPRGVRGSWVNSFLPQMLSTMTAEVSKGYEENPEAQNLEAKYLKDNRISNLESFLRHSDEHYKIFRAFLENSAADPEYFRELADSRRAKRFLSTWLDKYGHNSIARMGSVWLCCERISLLTAKSIEWARPGTGYIELSTRYVHMGGKDVYPIAEMLSAGYGVPTHGIESLFNQLFGDYKALFGEKGDGILPTSYKNHYASVFADADRQADLDMGISGETSDVLGNLLPLCTLTEVAIAASGEALPSILKHLKLDGTPENEALIEAILADAPKIGADNYARHWQPSQAETAAWIYPSDQAEIWGYAIEHGHVFRLSEKDIHTMDIRTAIAHKQAGEESRYSGPDLIGKYLAEIFGPNGEERVYHDKLPREFELASVSFDGVISMRGWRDLHRQSLNTHFRTLVGPNIGFYEYDKPQPDELKNAFKKAATVSQIHYEELETVPAFLRQYIMPMGWLVGFSYSGNLRQMEFSIWQRTKPSANHEVRQVFLAMNSQLESAAPWWAKASRASTFDIHREQKYIFARSQSEVGLPLRQPEPVA